MSDPLPPPALSNLSLVETVLRIRETVPVFNKNVGGSSEFLEDMISSNTMPRPYCWIVPMSEHGEGIDINAGTQLRHTLYAFIICADNAMQKGKGLGNEAPRVPDSINAIQDAIEQSLLTWEPESIFLDSPAQWMQRAFLGMDNTEVHYQLEFLFSFVRFSPYYFPKLLRDAWIEDNAGTIPGASTIKKIAARYNVDAGLVHQSTDDGFFAMPNANPAPSDEVLADFRATAAILVVDGVTRAADVTEDPNAPSVPAPAFAGHGEEFKGVKE